MYTTPTLRSYAVLAVASAAALLLSACGGSGSGSSPSDVQTGGSGLQEQSNQGGANSQAGRAPGTFGLIAQISGKTLQVQSANAQTAVTYSAATTFSQTVATARSSVKVGDCVVVRSSAGSATGSATGSPATPTQSTTQPTTQTAASVEISTATNGQCAIGAGGGFGGFGGGAGGGFGRPGSTSTAGGQPTGQPTGQPGGPGRGNGQRVFGAMTFGRVTSTSEAGFVVSAETFAGRGVGPSGSTASPRPSGTPTFGTRAVTVTTTASTTYTTTKSASATALAVGKCVAARGQADDTGAVTATTIAISPAQNGQCTVRGF
jgi:Domain of unknown function (DUF5666)